MIVAGFGYRSGATAASLRAALALAAEELAGGGSAVAALAAIADKRALAAPLAAALGLPLLPVSTVALDAARPTTRSPASIAARGTGSVAEASALAAAGPGARLIISRRISPDRMATCAIAQGATA